MFQLLNRASILFVFLIVHILVYAQGPNDSLYFQSISMKEGLPGSIITDFEQDSLGFMWIATNDGLCRYDGTNFIVFKYDPNNDNSLWNNYIQKLFIDKNQNLWIMTTNGLNKFDLKKNSITRVYATSEGGGLLDYSPIDMIETSANILYVASYYSGVSCINTESYEYTYLNTDSPGKEALNSNWINCLDLFKDSLVFIGYRNAGIDIYNINTKTTRSLYDLVGEDLNFNQVNVICQDNNNGLWIGTDAGLSHYNVKTGVINNYQSISSSTYP